MNTCVFIIIIPDLHAVAIADHIVMKHYAAHARQLYAARLHEAAAAVFEPLDDIATPAGSLLKTYLTQLASANVEIPNAQTFDTEVLTFLDRHQAVLSADDLIHIARILKLKFKE